jgi:hypothetical protein
MLFTTSLSSLLGLKYGIFLAGTSTRVPVFGLRPMRGWRWRVRKLPKPRISILSPPRSAFTMLSKIDSTITSDSLRVYLYHAGDFFNQIRLGHVDASL